MTKKSAANDYKQAHREAIWAVGLALGYFVWWYVSAYGFSSNTDIETLPPLYWGMPLWFLLSCIIGPIVFTILCALMVKFVFKDIPLDRETENEHE